MTEPVIKVENLNKSFRVGEEDVRVLHDLSFVVKTGDFWVIFGPSGCGKSTLLHTILGLEPPTTGKVTFLDRDFYAFPDEDARSVFRKRNIGMVYQQPNWIKALRVVDNVAFPLLLLGESRPEAQKKARSMLTAVGMVHRAEYWPTELSSGQQQRVALARALIINPKIIIADEPTGNLDFESGQTLMELLVGLNRQGKTIIMVTHDLDYLKYATQVIRMLDGRIIETYTVGDKGWKHFEKKIKSKRGREL